MRQQPMMCGAMVLQYIHFVTDLQRLWAAVCNQRMLQRLRKQPCLAPQQPSSKGRTHETLPRPKCCHRDSCIPAIHKGLQIEPYKTSRHESRPHAERQAVSNQ